MKRLLLASVAVALAVSPAFGEHGPVEFTATGTIAIAGPQTRTISGLTEIGSPCLGSVDPEVPNGTFQGVDGFWVELPIDAAGHPATLTAGAPNDVDAWFYDEGCSLINMAADPNAYSMASTDPAPDGNESGIIPAAARWAAIDLYVGAGAAFEFKITGLGLSQ